MSGIAEGYDTVRVTTPGSHDEAAARHSRDRDALAYLTRTGNADIAEILGPHPTSPPPWPEAAAVERRCSGV